MCFASALFPVRAVQLLHETPLDPQRSLGSTGRRSVMQVSRRVLEEVRSAKGAINRLIGRVQRIRQELEEILGDDADMQVGTWVVLPQRPFLSFPHACFY